MFHVLPDSSTFIYLVGENIVSSMDSLGPENGQTWGEDHQENHHDAEQDEGA